MKIKNHICSKCGMEVEVPDYDETRPISEYFPKWERTVLKHGWQHHRDDFPPQLKSFTQFIKWLTTPEGREWNQRQSLVAEAERIVRNSLSEDKPDNKSNPQLPSEPEQRSNPQEASEPTVTSNPVNRSEPRGRSNPI